MIFYLSISFDICFGCSKERLSEMVLLNAHYIRLGWLLENQFLSKRLIHWDEFMRYSVQHSLACRRIMSVSFKGDIHIESKGKKKYKALLKHAIRHKPNLNRM